MTAVKAPRGRPKGTGIDDQQRLAEMARLLGSDPRMKPTTAIKALGITDPSTIRRLRDKFNAAHVDTDTHGAPRESSPVAKSNPARVAALKISEPVKRVEAVQESWADLLKPPAARSPSTVAADQAVHAPAPTNAVAGSIDPAEAPAMPASGPIAGLGLNAFTTLFEQQMMIAQSVMNLPPVRDLIRQQIALTEFMLSVVRHSPGSRDPR